MAQARKKNFLRRRMYTSRVRKLLKRVSNLALHSPANFLGKQYLIQAELEVVSKNHQEAMSNFRSAILHTRESRSDMQSALANERFGKYLLEIGDLESARPILEEAYQLYRRWGATAKMKHLKDEIHCSRLVLGLT
jgi:tetratricopeptide (TPR) repeat protein